MEVIVNAKINLTLEVVGCRADGYHDLQSIIQTISLADQMTLDKNETLQIDGQGQRFMAEKSLILRAAYLFKERSGYPQGARIFVNKKIPFHSGMGGDSAGAAATLKCLNILWKTNWSLADLALLARELGSDVSFFIWGGTALMSGRGEKIIPLPKIPRTHFCVLFPAEILSDDKTASAFAKIDGMGYDQNLFTEAFRLKLETGQSILDGDYFNRFDEIADLLYPRYRHYKEIMMTAGASKVLLAGSGSALICPCQNEDHALKICLSLIAQGQNATTFYTV